MAVDLHQVLWLSTCISQPFISQSWVLIPWWVLYGREVRPPHGQSWQTDKGIEMGIGKASGQTLRKVSMCATRVGI